MSYDKVKNIINPRTPKPPNILRHNVGDGVKTVLNVTERHWHEDDVQYYIVTILMLVNIGTRTIMNLTRVVTVILLKIYDQVSLSF